MIKILTTVVTPTRVRARIFSYDVIKEAHRINTHWCGLWGDPAYWRLNGLDNLVFASNCKV